MLRRDVAMTVTPSMPCASTPPQRATGSQRASLPVVATDRQADATSTRKRGEVIVQIGFVVPQRSEGLVEIRERRILRWAQDHRRVPIHLIGTLATPSSPTPMNTLEKDIEIFSYRRTGRVPDLQSPGKTRKLRKPEM